MAYDRGKAADFYDAYGEREWTRFDDGRSSPLSVAIHAHYLRRFIRRGDRVLDAGAGPGRFTIELARLGAHVTVADVSPVQLELNRQRLVDAGLEEQIERRVEADILDLSAFPDDLFHAVVCYGGPLSYVMDRTHEALTELLRVTRRGGHLLVSVMSLVGAGAANLPQIVGQARQHGLEAEAAVLRTGDLPSELSGGHLRMHLYRWSELEALLGRHPCTIVAASASSVGHTPDVRRLLDELTETERAEIERWAIDLAAEPGFVSAGEHIIAVVRRDGDTRESQSRPGTRRRR